jgi:peptide/nickel transport system permease protein
VAISEDADLPRGRSRRTLAHRFWLVVRDDMLFVLAFLIILVFSLAAIFAPLIAPYDPLAIDPFHGLAAPSPAHLLGTDENGRDILSRLIFGARTSLGVASGAVLIALLVGVPLGLVAGYCAGWIDAVLMRFLDAVLTIPLVLLALLVVASLGPGPLTLIPTIGLVYVPYFARLVRGSVLQLKGREFVEASVATGAGPLYVVLRVLLPNSLVPIVVQIALAMSVSVLLEASLSFLGLGVQQPTPAWGSMLQASQAYLYNAPWYIIAPGSCIFLVVLAFNVLGDGLVDLLDPRSTRRVS